VNEDVEDFVDNNDNDFLTELNNINFQTDEKDVIKPVNNGFVKSQKEMLQLEKQRILTEKEQFKFNMLKEKEEQKVAKSSKNKKTDDDEGIYSNTPTEVLGKDKLMLLNKVKQYKSLFPEQLKTFKIKINPSVSDLKAYIDEMDTLVNTQNIDNFLTESILGCLKMIEGTTANFKNYNLVGLSDLLKNNKQFHTLAKQLYLKYNTFASIPPEHSMIMLVATTAYICKTKNSKKQEIQAYLNESIEI